MRKSLPILIICLFAVSFADFIANINYRKWRIMVDENKDSEASQEADDAHYQTRGGHYVGNRDGLSKFIKQSMDDWEEYKTRHNKKFESDDVETDHLMAFLNAQQAVRLHNYAYNRGDVSFKVDVNSIADLPFSEYKKLNGYRRFYGDATKKNSSKFLAPMNAEIPDAIDWRDHGYVTEVKNQGMCGSCWSFSATGSLEGQHKRATGELISLSEQNLVDCSERYGNNGCNGGLMDFAFQYIKENGGVDTEESYPYVGKQQLTCKFTRTSVGADDTGFVDLPEGDEEQLKIAVATQGPISVAIDAGHTSFQLYKKGVYYERKCSNVTIDHGVLVVGYGVDPVHSDYWIVKNSWGAEWGETGYMRMARNRNNHCGIASKASYPLV